MRPALDVPPPPPMYRTLVQYAGVDAALAQAWWTALEHARWSVPRTWKLDVVFFSQHHRSRTAELDGVLPFLRQTSPPGRVVQVLEALVQERLLARPEASAIEEKMLQCVDHEGRWCWSP